MTYSSTVTNDDDAQELTVETLLAAWQKLMPIVYYCTSRHLPVVDADGKAFCIGASYDDPMFLGYRANAAPGRKIVYLHPDNLPSLMQEARRHGFVLREVT